MIKAKKSLLAALFAVMMVVAFIPAMAFAADEQASGDQDASGQTEQTLDIDWGDYSYATYEGQKYTNLTKTYTDGKIVVAFDWTGWEAGTYPAELADASTFYWDFNNAEIDMSKVMTNASFAAKYDAETGAVNTGIKMLDPDKKAAAKPFDPAGTGLEVAIVAEGFDPNSYDVQTVTLTATVLPTDEAAMAGAYDAYVGAVPVKEITVQAKAAQVGDVAFYIDKEGGDVAGATVNATYDGAAHAIVNNTVPGFTVAYSVYSSTAKKYEAVDAVSFKDAGTYNAKAEIKDAKGAVKKTQTFKITVSAAPAVELGFDTAADTPDTFVKETYDAWDFVTVTGGNADAVKADSAALLAYYKAAYDITETAASKYDDTAFAWAIVAKDEAAVKAAKEANAALLANYADATASTDKKQVTILATALDAEIEFIDSPTAVTYKAKKLKKKAASFTVKAECTTGQAVAYKLINAPAKIKIDKESGKITLAKGLKKGTYKVKVKAYLPYAAQVFETQAIKIKVKK